MIGVHKYDILAFLPTALRHAVYPKNTNEEGLNPDVLFIGQ